MSNNTNIAAIFDVDGTLIADDSLERIFLRFLWRRGELSAWDLIFIMLGAVEALVAGRSPIKANKAYLRGKDSVRLARLARECFEQEIAPRLLPTAVNRLRWHQNAGHLVILLSGALDLLLEPLAEHLGVTARVGTELEVKGGVLTGRVSGAHPFGEAKAECLRMMSRLGLFNLKRSFAYADHDSDRYLLSIVGHPIAANPDPCLRRVAEIRGWMIEDFKTNQNQFLASQSLEEGIAKYAK